VWSNDPESYVGNSVAIDRPSHVRQVKSDDPAKRGHPSPPGWGLTTPPYNKRSAEKLLKKVRLRSSKNCTTRRRRRRRRRRRIFKLCMQINLYRTAFKFSLRVQGTELFCDSPLNHCVCLTIKVYKS
jgi:hypothetical protein